MFAKFFCWLGRRQRVHPVMLVLQFLLAVLVGVLAMLLAWAFGAGTALKLAWCAEGAVAGWVGDGAIIRRIAA